MTTDWKSTIHHAYTTPNLLHPTLQKSIPNLLRDEISKLANLKLFQTNIQASSSHSQVPVDMKFTDDSLHIRISKNAPWISLVPSTEPMSPEERAVDAVRKDVMEKIALLWGGISDSSSDESDSGHRSSSGRSSQASPSNSRRTRSRRSRRAENNRRFNQGRQDSITISGNTIDSSTHTTTNNYYGCTGSHGHSPHTDAREEVTSRRDANTQTDFANTPPGTPLPAYQSSIEEFRSSDDSRSSDSSSDESKRSFTSFTDEFKIRKKTPSDISDAESESSYYPDSSDESEYDSRSSFSIQSDINDEPEFSKPDSAQDINATIRDLGNIASHFERVISKEEIPIALDNLEIESEDEVSSQEIPDLMIFPDEEDSAQVVTSTIDYLSIGSQFERIISDDTKAFSKREQGTNTEDSIKRDTSSNTIPKVLKSTSTGIDPNVFPEKIRSNINQEVQTDKEASSKREQGTNTEDSSKRDTSSDIIPKALKSTSTETDPEASPEKTRASVNQGIQTEQDLYKGESTDSSTESIHSLKDMISAEEISNLNQFVSNSIVETKAFIELANNMEEELHPQLISSILTNRTILQELEDIIDSDPQLIIGTDIIDTLLHQLDLEALQLIHNDPNLEIPYFDREDSSSDSPTLVNSTETSVESEDSEDSFIDDEIKDQPIPTYMSTSTSPIFEDADDDSETLFARIQSWIDNPVYIEPLNTKETQSASTQTEAISTEVDEEPYTIEELKAEIESLVYDLESYKEVIANSNKRADEEVHKNQESARRALNLLDQQEILQKIIKNLDMQLDNAKSINKRLSSENDNLKKEVDKQDRRGIDAETKVSYLAQELSNSEKDLTELLNSLGSNRTRRISPTRDDSSTLREESPPVEQAVVENTILTPIKATTSRVTIPMEEKSKPPIKPKPTTSFKSDTNDLQRKLAAMQMGALRKEKAALELKLQKNPLNSVDRMKQQELLKHIDEELVQRNRRPQKSSTSTMTKESKTKSPLPRNERDMKDLGKEPFNTLQTKLNNKRTNNK